MKYTKIRFNIIITILLVCIFSIFNSVSAKDNNEKSNGNRKEIIVKYKDKTKVTDSKDKVKSKLGLKKFDVKKELKNKNIQVVNIDENDDINKVVEEIKKDPNVEYAQPNYKLSINAFPADSKFNEQWSLLNLGQSIQGRAGTMGVDINAIEAWTIGMGKGNVVIGILDSGIDINHEDLKNAIYKNKNEIPNNGIDDDGNGFIDDINGWDFYNNDNTIFDSNTDESHGTHIAGIIGAEENEIGIRGVASGVTIMPLKFINGNYGYTSDVIEAIEYAKKMGIKILNCSFGGTEYNPALKEAMENSGILFICAAGNNGSDVQTSPIYPAHFDTANVISVASIDNLGNLSSFSNYGSSVDIAAPGTHIISAIPNNNYSYLSGTSMAAANVTGVAALLLSQNDTLTNSQMKSKLLSSVNPIPQISNKVNSGGVVSAYKVLGGNEFDIIKNREDIKEYLDNNIVNDSEIIEYPFEFKIASNDDEKCSVIFTSFDNSSLYSKVELSIVETSNDELIISGNEIFKSEISLTNQNLYINDVSMNKSYLFSIRYEQQDMLIIYDGDLIIGNSVSDDTSTGMKIHLVNVKKNVFNKNINPSFKYNGGSIVKILGMNYEGLVANDSAGQAYTSYGSFAAYGNIWGDFNVSTTVGDKQYLDYYPIKANESGRLVLECYGWGDHKNQSFNATIVLYDWNGNQLAMASTNGSAAYRLKISYANAVKDTIYFVKIDAGSYVDFEYIIDFARGYNITVDKNTNSGTVTGGGAYIKTSISGVYAVLTASPSTGYKCNYWQLNGSTVDGNPLEVYVSTDATYTAIFEKKTYTITVARNPLAGGTVSGGGTFEYNNTATITATPNAGYRFVKWQKDGSDYSTTNPRTITVAANAIYTAIFEKISYVITVARSPLAGGTVSGGGTFYYNGTTTITATPNTGYRFVKWQKDGNDVLLGGTNPFLVTVTANATYTAVFEQITYTITVERNPTAGGTVTGSGTYSYNSSVILKATPNQGYIFLFWQKGSLVMGTSNSLTITVTEAASYTAVFAKDERNVSYSPSIKGTVSSNSDVDYYILSSDKQGYWNIVLTSPDGKNYKMRIGDWEGIHFATTLGSCEFVVSIFSADGSYDVTNTYNLSIRFTESILPKAILFFGGNGTYSPTGNYSKTYTDMSAVSANNEMKISRTYNSKDTYSKYFGRGWMFGFDGRVGLLEYDVLNTSGGIFHQSDSTKQMVKLPDGSTYLYSISGSTYTALDSRNTLIKNADNTYTFRTKDQTVYTFNTGGFLTAITDRFGNTTTIILDANGKIDSTDTGGIVDSTGRRYKVGYDSASGYINNISDVSSGRSVSYSYKLIKDNSNNDKYYLEYVTDPTGQKTHYTYFDSGVMNGYLNLIKDNNENIMDTIVYKDDTSDGSLKVYQVTNDLSNCSTYEYDQVNNKTTITDSNAKVTVQEYDDNKFINKNTITYGVDSITSSATYFSDDGKNKYGEMQFQTDINGNVTEYVRDSNGNYTKIINPDKSFKEFYYGTNNNLLWERDEEGNFTRYYYNSDNTLWKKAKYLYKLQTGTVELNETVGDSGYNKDNFSVEEYNYYPYSTTFKIRGLINTKTDALGYVTTYEYDHNNTNGQGSYNISKVINPESTSANSISTVYEYNSIGLKSAEISSMGYRTEYEYNNNGQLERMTKYTVPNPTATDKADMTKKEITRIVYDNKGRKIQEISPEEYFETYNKYKTINPDFIIDGLDANPKTHSYSDNSVGYRYVYNTNDTLISVTDPENNTTFYHEYDKYGNVIVEENPKQKDENGQLLASGAVYVYDYSDVLKRLKSVSYKESSTSTNSVLLEDYDYTIADGETITGTSLKLKNTVKITQRYLKDDTTKSTTVEVYDFANRILSQTIDYIPTILKTYYKNGNLYSSTDGRGNTTYYKYDTFDSVNGNTYNEQWIPVESGLYRYQKQIYDKSGLVASEVTSASKVANNISPDEDELFVKSYTYYKDGKLYIATDNEGRKTICYYDNDRNLDKQENFTKTDSSEEKITVDYLNNHLGKPKQKTEHLAGKDIYGNIIDNNNTVDLITIYGYDKNGNLETMDTPAYNAGTQKYQSFKTTYGYDKLNRKISVSQPGQDENGDPITICTKTTYNWEGKPLTEVDANNSGKPDADQLKTSYVYNQRGFLDKIKKQYKEGTTIKEAVSAFDYDRAGRKIIEVSPRNYDSTKLITQLEKAEFTYDGLDRVITKKEIFNEKTVNPDNDYALENNPVERVVKAYQYDGNGNVEKELDALGFVSGTGTTDAEKIENGYGISYQYNYMNLPTQKLTPETKDELNNIVSPAIKMNYTYNALGYKESESVADQIVKRFNYDGVGNLLTTTLDDVNQVLESNSYDRVGNLLEKTDSKEKTVTFVYNAFNKVRTIVYPSDDSISANNVTFQYDVLGRQMRKNDSLNVEELSIYDNQGRELAHTISKLGETSVTASVRYDANGNKRFIVDGNNNETECVYDELNRLYSTSIVVTDVDNNQNTHTTKYGYDLNNNKTSEKDWLNNETIFVYDGINRLVEKNDPYACIQKLEYNANNAQTYSYTPYFDNEQEEYIYVKTSFTYDKNNKQLSMSDAENHTTSQTYDEFGNLQTKFDGNSKMKYEYDILNRLTFVKYATKDDQGEFVKDPSNNNVYEIQSSYTYDLNNNMLTQTVGDNTTTFEYNVLNKPIRKIDHGGRTVTAEGYKYDSAKTENYTYYTNGLMKEKTDRNGNVTKYFYDCRGLLTDQIVDNEIIHNNYDGNGNQTVLSNGIGEVSADGKSATVTDAKNTTERTYDELNRVKTKKEKVNGISKDNTFEYQYDITTDVGNSGHVAEKTTDPNNNNTIKEFDKVGRLKKVKDSETATPTVYDYYYNGATKCITYPEKNATYPDGSKEEYYYYKDNNLKTLTNTVLGVEMDKYEYTYDDAHNQKTKIEKIRDVDSGTTIYTYDALNRLKTVTEPSQLGGKYTVYTYDNEGNRETEEVTQSGAQVYKMDYHYNEQNRLLDTETTKGSIIENVLYVYDNNGNLFSENKQIITPVVEQDETTSLSIAGEGGVTNEAEISFYTYDGFNQLITIQKGGKTISNTYNGAGLRVSKTADGDTTIYLYEYNKVVLELDGNGDPLARNVYGTNLINRTVDGETLYYLYNGHADVTSLLDNEGAIVAYYYYDAFGNPVDDGTNEGDISNPIRYAGYQWDSETGLYYLNARFYNAKIARFLQEDTFRGTANDPLSLNKYTYCANNPIKYWDPSGHSYNGTQFNNFAEFYKFSINNPQEAQMLLYGLNDNNQGYLNNIIKDYVKHQGSMQKGNNNVFQVIYSAPPGHSRNMNTGEQIRGGADHNMYDDYEFTLFDSLNWLIQTGGTGNFALQARVTDNPVVAADAQRHVVGMFMDAGNFLKGAGYKANPQLFIGSTEGNGTNAVKIYKHIMGTSWLKGNESIIGGIYYGNEDCNDYAKMLEVSSFIHGKEGGGRKLIWKPYLSGSNPTTDDILAFASKMDTINNRSLFDVIMIQPSTFYSGDYSGIDKVFNAVSGYNNPNGARVGMQIEFDMGLVTGRGDRVPFAPLQKRQFLNAYLDKIDALKSMGVPISIYSGGPNEQGYRNTRANGNTHNSGNHIPYWDNMPPADWYAYGVHYNDFPHNSYVGNPIYDINNYIYNGKDVWNPELTKSLWLTNPNK